MDNADQGVLFGLESTDDAIRQCATALGGMKATGLLLWPSMPADEAGRKLSRCLDPRKRDVLHVDEFLLLIREARRNGCLIGVHYVNDYCECAPPVPVTPEDEEDELMRDYIRAAETMKTIHERMELLVRRRGPRSAA